MCKSAKRTSYSCRRACFFPLRVAKASLGKSLGSAHSSVRPCCDCTRSVRGPAHANRHTTTVSLANRSSVIVTFSSPVAVRFYDHALSSGGRSVDGGALGGVAVAEAVAADDHVVQRVVVLLGDLLAVVEQVVAQRVELEELDAEVGDLQHVFETTRKYKQRKWICNEDTN